MGRDFNMRERNTIRAALAVGEVPGCPACRSPLEHTKIGPREDVPYVRRRVWLTCVSCDKAIVLDQPEA